MSRSVRSSLVVSRLAPRRARIACGIGFAVAATLAAPVAAMACAVCGQGMGNDQTVFLGSTALLSLLPLAMIAGGIVWIRKRSPELTHRGEFEERDVLAESGREGAENSADCDHPGPQA